MPAPNSEDRRSAAGLARHVARAQARYEAEPRLLAGVVRAVAARGAAGRAAGAVDEAAGRWRGRHDRNLAMGRALGWGFGGRDLVPQGDQRPHAAAVSRPRGGGARIARGTIASLGRDHRASRTSGVSGSAVDAARSGVRARPHVHVAVLDVRLDPAAGRDGRALDVDSSGAGAVGGVRAADGAHLHLAAGRRARGRGAGRLRQSPGAAPVQPRRRRRRPARKCA
jgi:hypothetical protein